MKTLYLLSALLMGYLPSLGQTPATTGSKNRVIVRTPRTATDNLNGDYPPGQTTIEYTDGLGRPLQTVGFRLSPQQRDVVQAQDYDAKGRPEKAYLPFRVDAQTGAFRDNPLADAQNQYGDPSPFAQPGYDNNNRVRQSYGPGQDWRTHGRTVSQDLQTAGNNIRSWRFVEDGGHGRVNGESLYSGNVLVLQTTTDENGRRVIDFTDREGKLVRRDVQHIENNTSDYLTTLYVYDDLNRLRCIVPPKAYATSFNFALDEKAELVFGFHYDQKGRLTEKLTPGGGWTHLVYNQLGQPIMTQDARQRPDNQWSFVKYDGLGRTIMTGVLINSGNRSAWQGVVEGNTYAQFETRGGGLQYYTNNSIPHVGEGDLLVVRYYDDHGWGVAGEGASAQGLPTGERARRLDNNDWLRTVIYYDGRQRPLKRLTDHHLGGTNQTDYEYNFAGDITKETVTYRRAGRGELAVVTRYEYDHAGRPVRVHHRVGNEPEIIMAEYDYDEIGRLSAKRIQPGRTYNTGGSANAYITRTSAPPNNTVDEASIEVRLQGEFSISGEYTARIGTGGGGSGTTNALQTMDYRYNIRGGLRSINGDGSHNPSLNSGQNDLFALKLDYHEEARYFNGNLSRQTWLSKNAPAGRTYQYGYDAADRLTNAGYAGPNGENYALNSVSYDRNGNITDLSRNGMTTSSTGQRNGQPTGFGLLDQLHYGYQNDGNRLDRVWDDVGGGVGNPIDFRDNASGGGNNDYGYYGDGSLQRDNNKGIASIQYNKLGLPGLIQFSGGRAITYVYDGAGAKLFKRVSQPGSTQQIDYVGDVTYRSDNLFSITTDEGRVLPTTNGSYVYEYQYRDHLGNLRVAFRQASQSVQSMSTNEPGTAAREQAEFTGVAEHREAGVAYEGQYSARVVDGVGPGKTLSVVAGETVRMRVMAYVPQQEPAKRRRWWPVPLVGYRNETIAGENGSTVTRGRWRLFGGIALPIGRKTPKHPDELPTAYLQYVLTDTAGRVLSTERQPITQAAREGWQELQLSVRVTQAGVLRVQVVNDGNRSPKAQTPVHFDNLVITQDPPVIVQETHYDPWGLELVGITSEGQPDDDYKFQDKEHEDAFSLEWDDFGARQYDPQLGRWHQPDPADQFASPYTGMGNNPPVLVDPDGRFIPLVFIAAAVIGGGLNAAAHWKQISSKSGWGAVGEFAKAFGIGAAAGVAGAYTGGAAFAAYGTAAGAGGFVAGAVSGAVGSATSSVIQGVGNAVAFGDPYSPRDLLSQTLMGAGVGGVLNGTMAALRGHNFWNGSPTAAGAGRFAIPGSGYASTLEGGGWQRVGKQWWNPSGGGNSGGYGGNLTFGGVADEGSSVFNRGGWGYQQGDVVANLSLRRTGQYLESINDIFANPSLLSGRSLAEVKSLISNSSGWEVGTLRQGRSAGSGWTMRELNSSGSDYTGRYLQWHPGTQRHFESLPYWKVSGVPNQKSVRLPAYRK